MNLNDFFKNFFGLNKPHGTSPFPGFHDDDDENQDGNEDMGYFFFHFDMNRQMEQMQKEMEDMFRNFGTVEFFPGIQQPESHPPKNPRDEMLKDKEGMESTPFFIQPHQPITPFRSPFSAKLPVTGKREDTDVDGKLDVDDVAKLFDGRNTPEMRIEKPKSYSFQKSYSMSTSRGPDGRVEQRKTVRDADGNEEVTITRSIGNQSHSVIIKKDKTGNEEKIENFNNLDENDINRFNKSWNLPQLPALPESSPESLLKDNTRKPQDPVDSTLFSKFFGSWFKQKD